MYYLNNRYYSPEWRRFINADSLFIAGDPLTAGNMYAYCNDNPVMYVDSDGTSANSFRYSFIKLINVIAPKKIKDISAKNNKKINIISQEASSGVGNMIGDAMEPASEYGENFASNALPTSNTWEFFADIPQMLDKNQKYRLRNIFPKRAMRLGAGLGAWVLDFHRNWNIFDVNYGNYTTLPGSTQWQSRVGYAWYYDLAFSLGGPTDVRRYEFESNNIYYIVWCWKADYWNLGAGAEIGIYYTKDADKAQKGYYQVGAGNNNSSTGDNMDLQVIVEMDVIYDGTPITENLVQKNWWITSFTPRIQNPDLNKLSVSIKTKFAKTNTCGDLMKDFYIYRTTHEELNNTGLTWAPTPYKNRAINHTNHRCNCVHPVLCTCNYTCCSNPCRYYSDFGDANNREIVGYDNGFEFYINY